MGKLRFGPNAADLDAPPQPNGQPARIGRIAVSESQAFVRLDTVTIAIDRAGRRGWPQPLPAPPSGAQYATSPLAADAKWLVTHDVFDATTHVGLFAASTGHPQWAIRYDVVPPQDPQGGPGRPPDEGRPGEGRPGEGPPGEGSPDEEGGDPAWRESQVRINETHAFIRDGYDLRAVGLTNSFRGWMTSSPRPAVGIELVGDLVLMAADQVYAFETGSGDAVWVHQARGARIAVTPDRNTIVAVSEEGVSALGTRWCSSMGSATAAKSSQRRTGTGHRPGRRGFRDLQIGRGRAAARIRRGRVRTLGLRVGQPALQRPRYTT